jgi:hypothetical protein
MNGGEAIADLMREVEQTLERASAVEELSGAADQVRAAWKAFGRLVAEIPGRDDGALMMMLNAVPLVDRRLEKSR